MEIPSVLVFGYGNPSRGDDALGPLLLEQLQREQHEDIEWLTDFQLQVEHALDLKDRRLVLFVDSHLSCQPPLEFRQLHPACDNSYTTHAMSPAAVLQVYREIRQQEPPPSFLLSIRGTRFELGEGLTPEAAANLHAATQFAKSLFAMPKFAAWLELIPEQMGAARRQ